MRPANLIVVGALAGGLAGCASPVAPSSVPVGVWGGAGAIMTVASTGTHVELDCAHGDVPDALAVDGNGRFSVAGTLVREHPGPVHEDQPPDRHPAVYAGSLRSNSLALTIRLSDTGQEIGSFMLALGAQGRVVKCL